MAKVKLTHITEKERKKLQSLPLEEKVQKSQQIIESVLAEVDHAKVGIAWTGGKDSTVLLWLIKQVCDRNDWPIPTCMFVDEGDVFPEILDFVETLAKKWQLKVDKVHNHDVSTQVKSLGEEIIVAKLNSRNQQEIKRLGYDKDTFPYLPESFVGNHLMKTVATTLWLEQNQISHLFVGVRWDEQGSRSEDDFLRQMEQPRHFRVEPILPITERNIWELIQLYKIPYVSLYEQGYRSLGAKTTTGKVSNTPAWQQDIEKTQERAGRQQDKEKLMSRLRALGYM